MKWVLVVVFNASTIIGLDQILSERLWWHK